MGSHTSSVDTQTVLDNVRHIVHALRESSRWAEKHVGLSSAQLFVLQKLGEAPALSVNELAARTRTHQSSVSTVVARLVKAGLLKRSRSAEDARRAELSLTARGRRLVDRAPDLAQERLIHSVERLSPARRRTLARILRDVSRGMDTVGKVPAMFFEDGRRRGKGAGRAR